MCPSLGVKWLFQVSAEIHWRKERLAGVCSLCHGFQRGIEKYPLRSIVLPQFCQRQIHMSNKKKKKYGEDSGLAGVSSKVGTDNVLIVSIFAQVSLP